MVLLLFIQCYPHIVVLVCVFLKSVDDIVIASVRPSVRLSVILAPPKPLDKIQLNLVCVSYSHEWRVQHYILAPPPGALGRGQKTPSHPYSIHIFMFFFFVFVLFNFQDVVFFIWFSKLFSLHVYNIIVYSPYILHCHSDQENNSIRNYAFVLILCMFTTVFCISCNLLIRLCLTQNLSLKLIKSIS